VSSLTHCKQIMLSSFVSVKTRRLKVAVEAGGRRSRWSMEEMATSGRRAMAFELPCREARRMQVVCVQSGRRVMTVEFDLKFHLLPHHAFTAYGAGAAVAGPAEHPIRLSRRQRATPDRFLGFLA